MRKTNYFFILLIGIIIISFVLRINQLGRDSFWNDEAGQAIAVTQPSIQKMIDVIKSHSMMMPLDYFVGRVMAKLGTSEEVLRLPSMLWGSLSIIILFVLTRKFTNNYIALIAVLLLSLSTPHIYYSQEFRPYASLLFFSLTSTLLLYQAIISNRKNRWFAFFLVTLIGIYFHVYVILILVNGFSFLFLQLIFFKSLQKQQIARLIISSIALVFLFGIAFTYLDRGQSYNYNLLEWDTSFFRPFLSALGWLPYAFTNAPPEYGLWEFINSFFVLLGSISLIKEYKKNIPLLSLILGFVIQFGLIIGADLFKGYWFSPRQILHITPLLMIVTGLGIYNTINYFTKRLMVKYSIVPFFWLATIGLIGISAYPRLIYYYQYNRSNAKEIVSKLVYIQNSGDSIFVIPDYEEKIYRFYFTQLQLTEKLKDIKPTSWQGLLTDMKSSHGKTFIITSENLTSEQETFLKNYGFIQIPLSGIPPNSSTVLFESP